METEESITVKVPDSEIDKIISMGIIRVLRYIGYIVYSIIDKLAYICFYMSATVLLLFSVGNIYGAEPAPKDVVWMFIQWVVFGAIWLSFKGIGINDSLAEVLKNK